jgi:hypothetical protein
MIPDVKFYFYFKSGLLETVGDNLIYSSNTFLEVGKTPYFGNKIWGTLVDAYALLAHHL